MSDASPDFNRSAEALRERAAECALTGDRWTWDDEELARSLGMDLEAEREAFELVAAELAVAELARARADQDTVPAALRARLGALAMSMSTATVTSMETGTGTGTGMGRTARDLPRATLPIQGSTRGFAQRARVPLAAAAGLVIGVGATLAVLQADRSSDGRASKGDANSTPTAFIRAHPRAVHWPWVGTSDPHVIGPVRGEAYFDPESEQGILEIEGLAMNDPTIEQYQLWIFDAERDERYPVDGGVFDVLDSGRVLIPVQARLDVTRPVMFAVTVEKPGGVVVSERQIAILARP